MDGIEVIIGGKLIEMGITPNLDGFRYIIESVKLLLVDESMNAMDIYEIVAEVRGVTAHRVERSIRTAFASANKDSCIYNLYFGTLAKKSNINCMSIIAWNIRNVIGG